MLPLTFLPLVYYLIILSVVPSLRVRLYDTCSLCACLLAPWILLLSIRPCLFLRLTAHSLWYLHFLSVSDAYRSYVKYYTHAQMYTAEFAS